MAKRPKLIYCSWSEFKIEEWNCAKYLEYGEGRTLGEVIDFEFRKVETKEPLLCDLISMVRAKAISAYQSVRVPCVVEHAGLILEGLECQSYPGGLTQPMWDALGPERFVASCSALGPRAVARAVIGYCDGAAVRTFVGDTAGALRTTEAGVRNFYWDTIFCPDGFGGKTYAEVADNDLRDKLAVSQSIKALRLLVDHRLANEPKLFVDV